MKTASIAALKAQLNAFLKESQEGPVIVMRNGKPIAALVAIADDDEAERLMIAHSPKFRAIIEKSRRRIEESGSIPHGRFWQEIEKETQRQSEGRGKTRRKTKSKDR
ncbi:MAG TPA: type II toxin-antitoxin system prevent-host-death family antitoxin [Pirellulales bacterium]